MVETLQVATTIELLVNKPRKPGFYTPAARTPLERKPGCDWLRVTRIWRGGL